MFTLLPIYYMIVLVGVLYLLKHRRRVHPLLLLLLFFVVLGLPLLFRVVITAIQTPDEVNTEGLLKTVAHLDLSYRDDLELVAVDAKNDVAFYTYVQPDRNVSVFDTVYLFDGVEATLTSVDAVGFTFTCDTIVSEGMSGTAIRNANGEQIGYISKRLSTGEYYAIWS